MRYTTKKMFWFIFLLFIIKLKNDVYNVNELSVDFFRFTHKFVSSIVNCWLSSKFVLNIHKDIGVTTKYNCSLRLWCDSNL